MSQHAHGFRAWIIQRLTAIYLLLFFVICVFWYFNTSVITFDTWRATFQSPFTIVLVSLFFISIFIHAWVGIRDIVIDYVHPYVIRLTLLSFILLVLFGMGVWVVVILAAVYVQ